MKKILILGGLWLMIFSSLPALNSGAELALSMAVPGYSQLRHQRKIGYAFVTAEAGIFASKYYFSSEAKLQREAAYTHALKYANLEPAEYDNAFMKNLGKYLSSGFEADGYNASVREEALRLYPGDPSAQQAFMDAHCYTESQYWSWNSPQDKARYNKYRNQARDLDTFGKLTMGLLIVNHLTNLIDFAVHKRDYSVELGSSLSGETPVLKAVYRF